MTWLLTSDTHLTDRPKDEYRFGLFAWLAKMQHKYAVTATFLLGDITDRKDNHSSTLVNAVIDGLAALRPPIYCLMGNHDRISPDNPYFKFLNCIEGLHFVAEPTFLRDLNLSMIPHMPDQAHFDAACDQMPQNSALMCHATITGASSETGMPLTGLSASPISRFRRSAMWAGDVHRPQTLKCGLTYVGSPFRIRFGDDFTPRCLLVRGEKQEDLHFPCLSKWSLTIRDADEIFAHPDLKKGDQVKITIQLSREEVVEWDAHKQRVLGACKELGLEVFGIGMDVATNITDVRIKADSKLTGPEDIFREFCRAEAIDARTAMAGRELLGA
jgi:DNA repair exonuclease SbcCD nuclease subunit